MISTVDDLGIGGFVLMMHTCTCVVLGMNQFLTPILLNIITFHFLPLQATFFYATGGPEHWTNKTNWLDYKVHECDWAFVPPPNDSEFLWMYNEAFMAKAQNVQSPCGGNNNHTNGGGGGNNEGYYRHLWYYSNNLQGSMPAELRLLTNLDNIVLSFNPKLVNTIPSQLGGLTQLEELWLFKNNLVGTIPSELGSMSSLTSLLLAHNRLTGSIPTSLGNLSKLQLLRLAINSLTGTLPSELCLLHNLTALFLMNNELSGTLPTCQFTEMRHFLMDNNMFTGPIPSELGQMHNNMTWMHLHHNQLTGTIPSELSKLTKLEELSLDNNFLTGTLPSELTELTMLQRGSFADNSLTGALPEGLDDSWVHLEGVSFSGNDLLGSIPSSFCNLTDSEVRGLPMDCSTDMLCGCDCPCDDGL